MAAIANEKNANLKNSTKMAGDYKEYIINKETECKQEQKNCKQRKRNNRFAENSPLGVFEMTEEHSCVICGKSFSVQFNKIIF